MAVARGVTIHRFGQTVSGFERFFALEVPHQHLARLRRWSRRPRSEQCKEVSGRRHFDCIAQPLVPIARLKV
jgi:hypothetical protein